MDKLDTSTEVGGDSIIARGPDILNESEKINKKYRERIERAVGEKITWERSTHK